jgi:hypothetical protein
MNQITKEIFHELKEHSPFTLTAALFGVVIMAFLLIKENLISHAVTFFYIFHPAHIFFSAIVSAAIFYNVRNVKIAPFRVQNFGASKNPNKPQRFFDYRKNVSLAILFSILISVIIGSISDIIFPYFGSHLFNIPISFHLPAIENPLLIFGVAFLGSLTGVIARKTKFPHFIHVLISIFASLLYIFAYSTNFSLFTIILIFIITSISVIIPCCLSDIVLPILFGGRKK